MRGKRSAMWKYTDVYGEPVGLIVRWDTALGKDILPISRAGKGWAVGGMPQPRPLYQLPDLSRTSRVYVCEGEKAADAARSLGLFATTSPHGCNGADKADWGPLSGKEVIILPDNDDAGRGYAKAVADTLAKLSPPPSVKILALPGLPEKGDVVEFIAARRTARFDDTAIRWSIESLAGVLPNERAQLRPQDSIPAPYENTGARIVFEPVPLSALGPQVPPEWIWPGYLAIGYTALFTGLWKAGKTTLVSHLIRDLGIGRGLVEKRIRRKVLVISEEPSSLWAARRDELGIGDHVEVIARPFKSKATVADWVMLLQGVASWVRERGYDLVIFDTVTALWPVTDENNAAEVLSALLPIHQITEGGAGVLLAHHPRKGDAGEGQASRGSGALPAFVDAIIELRRYNAEDSSDNRRVLKAYSRLDGTPPEIVLELTDRGYTVLGDASTARSEARARTIDQILEHRVSPGMTADEIRQVWPSGNRPSKRTVIEELASGFGAARWQRSGKGVKGDAYRYFTSLAFDSRRPLNRGAGMEFRKPAKDEQPGPTH